MQTYSLPEVMLWHEMLKPFSSVSCFFLIKAFFSKLSITEFNAEVNNYIKDIKSWLEHGEGYVYKTM